MTCIIGGKHRSGIVIIAADVCTGWEFRAIGVTRHEDTLQKLYGLAPNVAVAVCGELLPAQVLLQKARDLMERKTLDMTPKGVQKTIRRLPWLLRYLVKERKQLFPFEWDPMRQRVGLLIGVACLNGDARLFHWRSEIQEEILKHEPLKMSLNAIVEINAGNAVVSGSIEKIQAVHSAYQTETERQMTVYGEGVELNTLNIGAAVSSSLAEISRGEPAREVGVGGLFQIAAGGADGWFRPQRYKTLNGVGAGAYHVALTCNPLGRWFQINLCTRKRVPLQTLDEKDFSRAPTQYQTFTY